MANISAELAAISAAIYGRDVRSSIVSAIDKMNKVTEVTLSAGTEFNNGDLVPSAQYYENTFYINTNTWDLLRSDGSRWRLVDNISGNGITSIELTSTSGLVDTYTVHYTKKPDSTFTITNGNGISSIELTSTSGLVDTYTIHYNDGTSQDYEVANGDGIVSISSPVTSGLVDTYTINYKNAPPTTFEVTNGNRIYNGVAIRGKQVNPTIFNASGIANARPGDLYNNVSEGSFYHCASGGDPTVATWVYDFTITGSGGGASQLVDLLDVNISTPTSGQFLECVEIPDPTDPTRTIFVWHNADAETVYSGSSVAPISGRGVAEALDNYYTKTEIDTNHYTKTEIDTNHYTKTEIDTNHYTKTEIDNMDDTFTASSACYNDGTTVKVAFNNLNKNYGYQLCFNDQNTTLPDPIPSQVGDPVITTGTSSGTIKITYTLANAIAGTHKFALRILK